ncbi:sensor histidine kinase [Actinomadura macrotermitis]|uniref:histidine kinase n=1 Tax=Actinomadura macrotermitis TaxID=2585200 RepID=A0A7K0C0J3_9ACTN|nr:HAMP domain-containing sensor histidine kinase [Actinomadura macrotermitis]MQY06334.1 Adaptive-response sensory-kinase SasA [Actinomadura macrotermitis]
MTGRTVRWPPSRWSLGARVTAAATVIAGLLMVAGVLGLYATLIWAVDERLATHGGQAVQRLITDTERSGGHPRLVPAGDGFSLLQVVDEQGRVVAASDTMEHRPPLLARRPAAHDERITEITYRPGFSAKLYVIGAWAHTPQGWRVVYAGAPMPVAKETKTYFVIALVLMVPVTTVLIAWTVWHAVQRALRPVRRMRAELAEITGGEQHRRVTVPDSDDEVAGLAESVNVTLRRLEAVVERYRVFVADISHELRSPLTALRIQLELALEHPADEDWPAVARAALNDADRLQRLVGDLLIMARLDAGVPIEREPVDLGELARAEIARRGRRVPVKVETVDGAVVSANPAHLEQILTNLLDNAERHTRTHVAVRISVVDGQAVLTVTDDGSGIPPEDRELVFKRFQRLAEGRKRDRGGSGLGLPISRDLATAHGGTLVAEDSPQGARLVLRLPLLERACDERRTG